jgi:hypothetical protein
MTSAGADKERQMLGVFLVPGVYLRVLANLVRQLATTNVRFTRVWPLRRRTSSPTTAVCS